jgi:hypothetical protein
MSGFEPFSDDTIRWLQKFKNKGWLSDISNGDKLTYLQAVRQQLVTTSAPYQLTKKGKRVIRRFSN